MAPSTLDLHELQIIDLHLANIFYIQISHQTCIIEEILAKIYTSIHIIAVPLIL